LFSSELSLPKIIDNSTIATIIQIIVIIKKL